MAAVATLHDVDPMDGAAVAALAERLGVDLVVVGPEAPLVAGVADAVRDRGIAVLRAVRRGRPARGLEGVRQGRHGRGRGADRARPASAPRPSEAAAALDAFGPPYVVKDDGLAAGKGVVVTDDRDEALAHAAACDRVVIEEYLDGPEVSLFAITDGDDRLPAAAGAGLQADRRRRRGPEHRRHGRLHAAAVGAGRTWSTRCSRRVLAADRRRDGPPRHAVRRAAVRRPRADLARRRG